MIGTSIEAVDEDSLTALVTNRVSERRDLEYKRDLPATDDAKAEFLRDLTALANVQGGDLVFGVEDIKGVASSVPGIAVADLDAEMQRLENLIRDCVEPRLTGHHVHPVALASGRHAVVIRVRASLAGPHCVRIKGRRQYYARNSGGKYEMDAHELRHAFTATDQLPPRMRGLHADAVIAASGVDMPFGLHVAPHAVASIIPLGFFREQRDLAITPENALAPVKPQGNLDWMHTLEGVLMHTPLNHDTSPQTETNAVRSYALTHRQGRTDVAWTIGRAAERRPGEQVALVYPDSFENGLLGSAASTEAKLRALGIEGPWAIFATISGIKGFQLVLNQNYASEPAWRDHALLPEVVVEHIDAEALLPIFKAFWFLFGSPRQQ